MLFNDHFFRYCNGHVPTNFGVVLENKPRLVLDVRGKHIHLSADPAVIPDVNLYWTGDERKPVDYDTPPIGGAACLK